LRILDVLKEQGINQSQSGHVAYEMEQQPEKEIVKLSGLRSQVEKKSTEQVKDAHHDLSRKEAIRDHPYDKR
jgi:hypothetical protein